MKVLALVRRHWMIAFAVYPLVRFLLFAEPYQDLSAIQRGERLIWFSIWPLELAIIAAAMSSGFNLGATLRSLGLPTKVLVGAWLGACVWSSIFAAAPIIALRCSLEWLVHCWTGLAMLHLLSGPENHAGRQVDQFARLAPWVAIAVGLACMAVIYAIGLDSGYSFGDRPPGFAHVRHTGYLFAPAMILSIALIARSSRSWLAVLALTLNAALCLWFGSRGPFFGIGFGLIAAFALFPDFRRPALIARVGGATAAGAALSVLVPSPPSAAFNAVWRLSSSSADPAAFSTGRLSFWHETLTQILDKPLFGHGAGQFQHVAPIARGFYRHPHDFVLQFVFDWGVVGGGALLGLISLLLGSALRSAHRGVTYGQLGIFGAFSMLAFALLDGVLFYPYTVLVTLLFLILPFMNAQRHRAEQGAMARHVGSSMANASELR